MDITTNDILKKFYETDYYRLLDIQKTATKTDIDKAFRELVKKWHPDKIKNNTLKDDAERIYKKIIEAKEVLVNKDKRQLYDLGGIDALKVNHYEDFIEDTDDNCDVVVDNNDDRPKTQYERMQQYVKHMHSDINDLYSVQDLIIIVEMGLEDLYMGKEFTKTIVRQDMCRRCNGFGTGDGKEHKCLSCRGNGFVVKIGENENGEDVRKNELCKPCGSTGVNMDIGSCKLCNGGKFSKSSAEVFIRVPAGTFDKCRLIIQNEGNEIPIKERHIAPKLVIQRDGTKKNEFITRTNLQVFIHERRHDKYERMFIIKDIKEVAVPKDLKYKLHISLIESLLGFNRPIKMLDGSYVWMKHETPVNTGQIFVIPNHGMPNFGSPVMGHLYVEIVVDHNSNIDELMKKKDVRQKLCDILGEPQFPCEGQPVKQHNEKNSHYKKPSVIVDTPDKYKFDYFLDLHNFPHITQLEEYTKLKLPEIAKNPYDFNNPYAIHEPIKTTDDDELYNTVNNPAPNCITQ